MQSPVVVITGAAGGIGRALAARWAAAGARLALLDRDVARLEAIAAELSQQGHVARALPCDITDPTACEAAVRAVCTDPELGGPSGGIDVLINNAGIPQRSGFAETELDVFRRVMDVNFFGALYCTKAALPSLRARRGTIIVISSIAGVAPLYGRSGYAASKHALHGLFETARAELAGEGVHVMLVCPSFTASGFEDRALGAHGEQVARPRTQVGRIATPAEVASAIYRGAAAREPLLVLSPVGKLSYYLSRLWPGLYARLMTRSLRGELVTAGSRPVAPG